MKGMRGFLPRIPLRYFQSDPAASRHGPRIVPVEGKDGQRVSKSFVRPQYVPVSRKQFETIEVNIKRDTGEPVPFEFGRVLITLHFRQSRPLYL